MWCTAGNHNKILLKARICILPHVGCRHHHGNNGSPVITADKISIARINTNVNVNVKSKHHVHQHQYQHQKQSYSFSSMLSNTSLSTTTKATIKTQHIHRLHLNTCNSNFFKNPNCNYQHCNYHTNTTTFYGHSAINNQSRNTIQIHNNNSNTNTYNKHNNTNTYNNNNNNRRQYLLRKSFSSSSSSSPKLVNITPLSLSNQKRKGQKITMVTAYDYPSALHVQRASIDIVLIGDSAAMVELGYNTTQPMTLLQMIHHCQAVKRGIDRGVQDALLLMSSNTHSDTNNNTNTNTNTNTNNTHNNSNNNNNNNINNNSNNVLYKKPLLVGDMPFGTYEFQNTDIALQNSYTLLKEGNVDAVKLEGGSIERAQTVQKLVQGGIAVMGHVGLTPQAISVLGGFRAQGRTASRARVLLDEALRIQDAGAFAVVLECVPDNVAKAITETLEIPTIGIGAGNYTSGQVLVYHDMLGMSSHPHHEEFMPKFCKRYANLGLEITRALKDFKNDVEAGVFPGTQYSPYVMNEKEQIMFQQLLDQDAMERIQKNILTKQKLIKADEYEQLNLYGGGATVPSSSQATTAKEDTKTEK